MLKKAGSWSSSLASLVSDSTQVPENAARAQSEHSMGRSRGTGIFSALLPAPTVMNEPVAEAREKNEFGRSVLEAGIVAHLNRGFLVERVPSSVMASGPRLDAMVGMRGRVEKVR